MIENTCCTQTVAETDVSAYQPAIAMTIALTPAARCPVDFRAHPHSADRDSDTISHKVANTRWSVLPILK